MQNKHKSGLKWMMLAVLLMATAVMLGAFGSHGLKSRVDAYFIEVWQTAVLYQFFHAVGLFLLGVTILTLNQKIALIARHLQIIGGLFASGVFLFSGSLYILVLTGVKVLGIITPIGGALFILGWILFFIALLRYYRNI